MRRLPSHAPTIAFGALLAALTALVVTATAYHLAWMRDAGIARVQERASGHAQVFEAHLTQTLTLIDQNLRGAGEDAANRTGAETLSVLQQLLRRAPYLRSLSVLDVQGRIVVSSGAANVGLQPVLDELLPVMPDGAPVLRVARPWSGRDFADGRPAGAGQPVPSRSPSFIPMVRGIGDGRAVLAAVNPDYFVNAMLLTLPAERGTVEVARLDGVVLFSTADGALAPDVGSVRRPLAAAAPAAAGSDAATDAGPGDSPVVLSRRGSRLYPLTLQVELPRHEELAAYRDGARAVLAVVLPGYGVTMLCAMLAYRQLRRQLRERHEIALRAHDRLAGRLFDACADGIVITDHRRSIVAVNPAYEQLSGYSRAELIGRHPSAGGNGAPDAGLDHSMWDTVDRSRGQWKGELVNRRKDGSEYPAAMTVSMVTGDDGKVSHYFAICGDITERREREARIRFLSEHDNLTGLPNRALVCDRLERALIAAPRSGHRPAVLFVDLDRFKTINDTHGHRAGDQVLCEVARRISGVLRASDTVGRQGGDEFVVVLHDLAAPEDAARVAEKIVAAVVEPIRIDDEDVQVGASIGIASWPDDGQTLEELMHAADTAMYHGKSGGGQAWHFFSPSMADAARERAAAEDGLRRTLLESAFHLHYLPVVSLADGRPTGMEATLRWRDAGTDGRLMPVTARSAEELRLLGRVGQWVLQEACAHLTEWRTQGLDELTLRVNISALQLDQPGFADTVLRTLEDCGLPGSALVLELSEGVLMRRDETRWRELQSLRGRGVAVAIDDFGSGFSALTDLRRMPVDQIKLDRAFVAELHEHSPDAAVAGTLIGKARAMGLKVVGLGADTIHQWGRLQAMGCDEVQGMLAGHAMPPAAAPEWVRTRSLEMDCPRPALVS